MSSYRNNRDDDVAWDIIVIIAIIYFFAYFAGRMVAYCFINYY